MQQYVFADLKKKGYDLLNTDLSLEQNTELFSEFNTMNHLYDASSPRNGYQTCQPVSFQYVTTAFGFKNEMPRSFFQQYGRDVNGSKKEGRVAFFVHGYYDDAQKIDFHQEFLDLLGAEFMSAEKAVNCEQLSTGKPKLLDKLPEAGLPRWALRQILYELMQGQRVALILDEEGESTIRRSRAILKEIYASLPYAYRRGCGCMTNCTLVQLLGMKNMMSGVYLALMERCKDTEALREDANYFIVDLNDVPIRRTGIDEAENQMLDFLCDASPEERTVLFDAAEKMIEKSQDEKPELRRYVVPYELSRDVAGKATPGNIFGWGIRLYNERLSQNDAIVDQLTVMVKSKLTVAVMYDYFRQCGVPETLELTNLERFVDNPEKKVDYNAFYGSCLFEQALRNEPQKKEILAKRLAELYLKKLLSRMEKGWKEFPTDRTCKQLKALIPPKENFEEDRIRGIAQRELYQMMQNISKAQEANHKKKRTETLGLCNLLLQELEGDFSGKPLTEKSVTNVECTLDRLNTSSYLYDAELRGLVEPVFPQYLLEFEQSAAKPTTDAEYEQREEAVSKIKQLLGNRGLTLPEGYDAYSEKLHQEWETYTKDVCTEYADTVVSYWNKKDYQQAAMKQLIRLPEELREKARLLTRDDEKELNGFYRQLCCDTAEKVQNGLIPPLELEKCREWEQLTVQLTARYDERKIRLDRKLLQKPAVEAVRSAVLSEIVQELANFTEKEKGRFYSKTTLNHCVWMPTNWVKLYPECIVSEELQYEVEKRYIETMITVQRNAAKPSTLKECAWRGETASDLLAAMEKEEKLWQVEEMPRSRAFREVENWKQKIIQPSQFWSKLAEQVKNAGISLKYWLEFASGNYKVEGALYEDICSVLNRQFQTLLVEKRETLLENKEALYRFMSGPDNYGMRDTVKAVACEELSYWVIQPDESMQSQLADVFKLQRMLAPDAEKISITVSETQASPDEFVKIVCFLSKPSTNTRLNEAGMKLLEKILNEDAPLTKRLFQSVMTADGALALLAEAYKRASDENTFKTSVLKGIFAENTLYEDADVREISAAMYMEIARRGMQLSQDWKKATSGWWTYLKGYQKKHWNEDFGWVCPEGSTPEQQVQYYRRTLKAKREESLAQKIKKLDLSQVHSITWFDNTERKRYLERGVPLLALAAKLILLLAAGGLAVGAWLVKADALWMFVEAGVLLVGTAISFVTERKLEDENQKRVLKGLPVGLGIETILCLILGAVTLFLR